MSSPQLCKETVVCPPDPAYPLHVMANRYSLPEFEASKDDPSAFTLICLHSTSFHKETWEPTLQHLLALSLRQTREHRAVARIREAWAIEAPNHGASAQLNEKALQLPEFCNNFTCHKYADAVHRFLTADLAVEGAAVNFTKRNLVGIGQSLGAVSITILTNYSPLIPIPTLILIEPMLSPAGAHYLYPLRDTLIRGAYERRDVWGGRDDAFRALKNTHRTQKWDPRIVGLFVEYGLRPHPSASDAVAPYPGVTLSLTRDQEAGMYRDIDALVKPVADLNKASAENQVHLILGTTADYVPKEVHDTLTDFRFASVTRIEGSGHLVAQEKPDALGNAIFDILDTTFKRPHQSKPESKL